MLRNFLWGVHGQFEGLRSERRQLESKMASIVILCLVMLSGIAYGQFCGEQLDDFSHTSVAVHVSRKALDTVTEATKIQLKHDLPNIEFPNGTFPVLGGNLTIRNLRVDLDNFQMPDMSYDLVPPKSVYLKASGGNLKVCGDWAGRWESSLTTLFHNIDTEGKFCVWTTKSKGWLSRSESELNIKLRADVGVGDNGEMKFKAGKCNFNVPFDLDLTGGGNFGGFVKTLRSVITMVVKQFVSGPICGLMNQVFGETLQNPYFLVNDRYGVNYTLREVSITKDSVEGQIAANVTSLF